MEKIKCNKCGWVGDYTELIQAGPYELCPKCERRLGLERVSESPAPAGILSPEEWLENMGLDFPVTRYGISVIMEKYAGHVAAKVHRETLRLAASQLLEYPFQPEQARKAIRSIPLQDVYPAVEKTTHTDGQ